MSIYKFDEEKTEADSVVKALTSICARLGAFQEQLLKEAEGYEEAAREHSRELEILYKKIEEETGKDRFEVDSDFESLNESYKSDLRYHEELKDRMNALAQNIWEILDLFSSKFEAYMYPDWEE